MIKLIKFKNKIIGEGYPTFLIAEMACAHQGDLQNALNLVDRAVKAKADAIQLQVYKKELDICPLLEEEYQIAAELEFSQGDWLKIINLIKKNNILLFAACYDFESVVFLIKNDVDAFKVHSADLSNPELLLAVAKAKKPIFLSTGASKLEEIKNAINFLRKNGSGDIVLMHGYQGFPTKIEETNLNYIETLERVFGLNVGFYDHVDGGSPLAKIIPIMAIGYGAQVIEKHFILNREEKGYDFESSLNPSDFEEFAKILRESEKAIGNKEVRNFTEGELKYRANCKKSIVAKVDIPKNIMIKREHVMFVRNVPGIPPDQFYKVEGKIIKKNIKKYQNIRFEDF